MTIAAEKAAHIWERDGLDWYVEEPRAAAELLKVERFVGHVWDPCCGQGNIVKELLAFGYDAIGTDIVQRVSAEEPWFKCAFDFRETGQILAPNIVMNPPFFKGKGTEEFIRRALALAKGKVAAFVDVKFLAGSARANGLYREHRPTRVWFITPRISCPPGEWLAQGNKAGGGTADWCWLVWDLTAPIGSATQLGWLRKEAA